MPAASRPYHHGDLRKALLAEAAKVIEGGGVTALSLRELARRLGVSHAAPLNHFADKDALLSELAAEGFDDLAAALSRAMRVFPKPQRLGETGRAYVDFALRRPGHFRVMFGHGAASAPTPRLAEAGGRAFAVLAEAVAEALGPSRARSAERVAATAFFAWSTVHGAATLLLDAPLPHALARHPETARALADQATMAVAKAIRAR
jgi:AcrR family transcriptional regulator